LIPHETKPQASPTQTITKAKGLDGLLTAQRICRPWRSIRFWVVSNYLPEGLSLLAGKPKIGKPFMALDAAVGVATGSDCLALVGAARPQVTVV
jgi:hypothetical protein